MAFFSKGSFINLAKLVLWLAALFCGVAGCALGVAYPPKPSVFVLPEGCLAGKRDFDTLYSACFAVIMSCTVQAFCSYAALCILGSKKQVDDIPALSGKWCRYLLVTGVFFCTISFACLVVIADFMVFVKISKYSCFGWVQMAFVIAADSLLAVVALIFFTGGSLIALHYH
ncbi:hypothetical protein ACP70R_033881 [Stipagrostis hirtigluma subsp. patula]